MKPKVLILSGHGINCENETAFAFTQAGAQSEIVHVNDLIAGGKKLNDFQILVFPGGFSFGDHLGAGKALATRIAGSLQEQLARFVQSDKLVLGICNGFQVMANLGIFDNFQKRFALVANAKPRYLCTWVDLQLPPSRCVFTKGLKRIALPIAHGEGNFFAREDFLDTLESTDRIACKYLQNPNGSARDIAGICDQSGRVFGLMPHPERALFFHNRPDFFQKKEELQRSGKPVPQLTDSAKIFENAVRYFL